MSNYHTQQTLDVEWLDALNRGLVAWWPFRQSGGNTLRDVASKHHAALTGFGGDEWQVGFAGNTKSLAYNPSGGDDRATVTGFPHLPGAFTLSAWIKSSQVDTLYRSIIERGPWTSTNCNFDFGLRSSGTSPGIYCFWKDNTTLRGKGAVGSVGAVTDAIDGEWHHVVATVDSNFDLVIYNNGQVATTDGANTGSADNSAALTIGGSTSGTSFMGSISDARIYDRALSAAEVHGLYVASRTGYPTQFKRRARIGKAPAAGPTYTLAASAGSFTLTGNATALTAARKLPVTVGTFTLTGNATALTAARKLPVTVGTFTLSGIDVTLTYTPVGGPTYTLAAAAGAFTLTGNATGLARGYTVAASVGAYTLTGNATALTAARQLPVTVVAFTLTGNAVTLTYSGTTPPTAIAVSSASIEVPKATGTIVTPKATGTIQPL